MVRKQHNPQSSPQSILGIVFLTLFIWGGALWLDSMPWKRIVLLFRSRIDVVKLSVFSTGSSIASAVTSIQKTIKERSDAACPKCSILVIDIDSLGSEHLPCYGYEKNTAPGLCAFAKKNILFSNSFAQSYWTLPSTFSMITGLYPKNHKMYLEYRDTLDPSIMTLPEYLKRSGYSTFYFGNTKSTTKPMDKGFSRGFETEVNQTNESFEDWNAITDTFIKSAQNKKTFAFVHTNAIHSPYYVGTDTKLHFTSEKVDGIPLSWESYMASPMRDAFYAFVRSRIEQSPDITANEDTAKAYQEFIQASSKEEKEKIFQTLKYLNQFFNNLEGEYLFERVYRGHEAYVQALYDEQILKVDAMISHSLQKIEKELPEKTIIILTSDHGEAFREHGTFSHQTLYGEVQRTPLILSIPGYTYTVIPDLIEQIDLAPTILSLVRIPYEKNAFDGKNLACLSHCAPNRKNTSVISEELHNGTSLAIVKPPWKLYAHTFIPESGTFTWTELFDLTNDKKEATNVASLHPDVVLSLQNELVAYMRRNTSKDNSTPLPTKSERAIEDERKEKINYFHY